MGRKVSRPTPQIGYSRKSASSGKEKTHIWTLFDPRYTLHGTLPRAWFMGGRLDQGSCSAIFTEQGASACHMTAACVPDTLSRLPGTSGEANHSYSSLQMGDAPRWRKFADTECSTF